MLHSSVVEVNLSAIDRNLKVIREIVGQGCGLCPIVKADAYGLGAPRVGARLAASGADLLAVYSPEQGAALLRAGVNAPLLILMQVREIGRTDELYRALMAGRLHLTLHDAEHLEAVRRIADRYGAVVQVHVEIDTGLGRGGAPPTEAVEMVRSIAASRRLRLCGLFTHFSDARSDPERTAAQLAAFDAAVAEAGPAVPPTCLTHVASTYSLLRHPRFHRSMVRFGLAWAGYGLEDLDGGEVILEAQRLTPAVTWASTIVQVKTIEAGASVGYGSMWTARRRSVVGLVPVGYADGYPLARPHATGPAMVGVVAAEEASGTGARSGRRLYAPVLGAVNMDQVTIDLTDVIASGVGSVGIGTRVELISADATAPNHLPKVAAAAGTIPHDLLCRLGPGVRRVYVEDRAAGDALARKTREAPALAGAAVA